MTEAIAWVTPDSLISVTGDDARTWLNGQITNDLKQLSPDHPVYGLILSVKGRILSDVLAIDHPEHGLLMAVPRGTWAVLLPHLEHYIIMEDVALTPREDLALVTIQGGDRPEGFFPHARLSETGWDSVVSRDRIDAVLASARRVDEAEIESLRIRAGKPRFGADFGDTTYPQEVGLEKSAVSFKKGCYLGQEVVCMLESRGQISRRLVRLEGPGLEKGVELKNAAGEKVGEVTSAASDCALGIVKRAQAQAGLELMGAIKVVALA